MMENRLNTTASYLRPIWDRCDELIATAKSKTDDVLFDTLIGTGVSGSIIVPLLAKELGCFWAIVRKPNDGSHSGCDIEGDLGERWIFVDDLVNTGATVERTRSQIAGWTERFNWETEYGGAYLYYREIYYPPQHDFISWNCRCSYCKRFRF
jgi:orotate phosphoribosyltransferase-like protein